MDPHGRDCDDRDSLWLRAATWFAHESRALPWREEPRDPWAVLVSEIMLQQTQVSRVEPAFGEWLRRWPSPASLAADPPGEAVRAWAGLGYPRRALRLHQSAMEIEAHHEGRVPDGHEALVALPGVGEYTAAAVLAFAHKRRVAVLDTNVRRVLQRHDAGREFPSTGSPGAVERQAVTASLPADPREAAVASEAVMELGALVCRARGPLCERCPIADTCAWLAAGRPTSDLPVRRTSRYEGSDRQARGVILRLVRLHDRVAVPDLAEHWPSEAQRTRAWRGLLADGLLEHTDGFLRLPSSG